MKAPPKTRPAARQDGFVPLEAYAALGDGRNAALVASDGRIDWWAIPTLDSPPVCAAILDPEQGGHFLLAPEEDWKCSRRYLPRTNVLETEYVTQSGTVRVTETLNVGTAGRLPWTELARRIDGLSGEVPMRWELAPGERAHDARPWSADWQGTPILHVGDQSLGVIVDGGGTVEMGPHRAAGRLRCRAGQRSLVAVVASDAEPLFVPSAESIQYRLDRTADHWRRWSDLVAPGDRWPDAVLRSALVLKTLLYEPSGAIAAAATMCLPELIGGDQNWDYRYAWVRDSSFTLDALIGLQLHEEVHHAVSWLLSALKRTAPDLPVFYRLDGTVPTDDESELDLRGYRGSTPVRSGNRAAKQTQLGTFGDLFDTIHRYVAEGHVLDPRTSDVLGSLADRCCDTWTTADSGIWELPDLQHYTISKIGCWTALDRAARMAEAGHLHGHSSARRWRREAEEIKAWVDEHCWSKAKGSYSMHAGTDRLDAAVLLAGRTGFERGERLASTVEAVRDELGRGPLVYRYSGQQGHEGCFVACTFWVIDALARLGRVDEAAALMEEALRLVNDVGLLSEEIDGKSGSFLGNLPQGLSHLALISAAHTIEECSASVRRIAPTGGE